MGKIYTVKDIKLSDYPTLKSFQQKLQLTEEQAIQLFLDDKNDYIGQEGEKMTENAKKYNRIRGKSERVLRNGIQSRGERKTSKLATDEKKTAVFEGIKQAVEKLDGFELTETKSNTKISFTLGGEKFSVTVTKHRK